MCAACMEGRCAEHQGGTRPKYVLVPDPPPARRYLAIGKHFYFRLWKVDPTRYRVGRGTVVLADWETELLFDRHWWRVSTVFRMASGERRRRGRAGRA